MTWEKIGRALTQIFCTGNANKFVYKVKLAYSKINEHTTPMRTYTVSIIQQSLKPLTHTLVCKIRTRTLTHYCWTFPWEYLKGLDQLWSLRFGPLYDQKYARLWLKNYRTPHTMRKNQTNIDSSMLVQEWTCTQIQTRYCCRQKRGMKNKATQLRWHTKIGVMGIFYLACLGNGLLVSNGITGRTQASLVVGVGTYIHREDPTVTGKGTPTRCAGLSTFIQIPLLML